MNVITRLTSVLAGLLLILPVPQVLAGPPLYTISREVVGSGVIVLDPDKSGYQKNNVVTVTAEAGVDWTFDHWEGDLAGTQNPTTLRVSGEHVVRAVFTDASSPPPPGTARPPLPASGMIVSYFAQWTIYRRGYLPRDVVVSGAATATDVINYAFAGIDENLRCASLDPFADYQKRFDSAESVDSVADTVSQPLKGNFNQLLKLKAMYPHVRVLLSIGGWTESYRFSDAALPANREAFVRSCIDAFVRGHLEPGVSAAGVFDGLDIDWEYPGSCGNTCDYRPDDRQNFVALLAEFRRQLDLLEDEIDDATGARPDYLLTIAAPGGEHNYAEFDMAGVASHVDWINAMTYDFHGGWESSGPANHHAQLFRSPCDPEDSDWADKAVRSYLQGGVPATKLLLGIPFYGRGWRGVASANDGLCQPARGVARGTYEKGVDDYEVLSGQARPGFHDQATGTHWTFDGTEFWSFDDPISVGWKADYVRGAQLRGSMVWELSGDTAEGDLLRALRSAMPRVMP